MTVTRRGEPREEVVLLESEVAVDVLFEEQAQLGREGGDGGLLAGAGAGRTHERRLDAAQQGERRAMLGVERAGYLSREFHGPSNNGIRIPN